LSDRQERDFDSSATESNRNLWTLFMKGKFKQKWSTIPPVPTKETTATHLKTLTTNETMTCGMGKTEKSRSWLGTGTKMGKKIKSI
jgi:hypothetical protein